MKMKQLVVILAAIAFSTVMVQAKGTCGAAAASKSSECTKQQKSECTKQQKSECSKDAAQCGAQKEQAKAAGCPSCSK